MNESFIENKITEERIQNEIPLWERKGNKLHREYRFRDFQEAFSFMTAAALSAENLEHHPEWRNIYNKVVVDLTTHEVGGITNLDFELAVRFESHFQNRKSSAD